MSRLNTFMPGEHEPFNPNRGRKNDLVEELSGATTGQIVDPFYDELIQRTGLPTDIDQHGDPEDTFPRVGTDELEALNRMHRLDSGSFQAIQDPNLEFQLDTSTKLAIIARTCEIIYKTTGIEVHFDISNDNLTQIIREKFNCDPDATDEIAEELASYVYEELMTQGILEGKGDKLVKAEGQNSDHEIDLGNLPVTEV